MKFTCYSLFLLSSLLLSDERTADAFSLPTARLSKTLPRQCRSSWKSFPGPVVGTRLQMSTAAEALPLPTNHDLSSILSSPTTPESTTSSSSSTSTRSLPVVEVESSDTGLIRQDNADAQAQAHAHAIDNSQEINWSRQTIKIAAPALVSLMSDPLLSFMDTAFVGRLGSLELASLGACSSIFHLAFNTFRATTEATASLVAAEPDPIKKKVVTLTSLKLGLFLGTLVCGLLWFGGDAILHSMGIPKVSSLYPFASTYLRVRCLAGPFVLIMAVVEGAFRGYGDTKTPLRASAVAALLNLVLDPLLIFPLKLGVGGAAAATAISQVGAAAIYLYLLEKRNMLPVPTIFAKNRKNQSTKEEESSHHVNKANVVKSILKANMAMLSKHSSLLLAWTYAAGCATRLGPSTVAAHQVAVTFWLVLMLITDGTAVSAQVLTGQIRRQIKHGVSSAKKRLRSLTSFMAKGMLAQGTVVSLLWYFGVAKWAPVWFTTDPAVRNILTGTGFLSKVSWTYILVSSTMVMEAMAVGGHYFSLLGGGTFLSAAACISVLRNCTNLNDIWLKGFMALFAGRFLTASSAVIHMNFFARRGSKQNSKNKQDPEHDDRTKETTTMTTTTTTSSSTTDMITAAADATMPDIPAEITTTIATATTLEQQQQQHLLEAIAKDVQSLKAHDRDFHDTDKDPSWSVTPVSTTSANKLRN